MTAESAAISSVRPEAPPRLGGEGGEGEGGAPPTLACRASPMLAGEPASQSRPALARCGAFLACSCSGGALAKARGDSLLGLESAESEDWDGAARR